MSHKKVNFSSAFNYSFTVAQSYHVPLKAIVLILIKLVHQLLREMIFEHHQENQSVQFGN